MSELKKINDEALDNITGGATKRTVNTHTSQNAVVRKGPGVSYPQVASLPNGTVVRLTGESVSNFEDGRDWYEISSPCHGWIAGSLIGL